MTQETIETAAAFAEQLLRRYVGGLETLEVYIGDRLGLCAAAASRTSPAAGCWSSIAIARAYPQVTVDGYDLDEASIELARTNAHEHGVSERVEFHVADASDPSLAGRYDLVTVFEALHDVAHPVELLDTTRRLAGPDGIVIVMDERGAR